MQKRNVFADVTFACRAAIERPGMKKILESPATEPCPG